MREVDRLMGFDFRTCHMESEEREGLLRGLKRLLEGVGGIVFAYAHGGFVELDEFRDVDAALWVKDPEDAFSYAVDLSARLEAGVGVPVDVHVLNDAPLSFKCHVFTEGELLLSADDEFRVRMLDETLRRYFDVKELNRAAVKPGSFNERR
ncbi:MAG: nucleotidyltransferase domain-containing protein [Candidatus Bathyarchaeota archaeon]